MSTKLASLFTAAAVSLVATSAVNAAFFALGTSSTVAPTDNASVVARPGDTVTLQLWGRATGPLAGAYLNLFSLRLEGTGLAVTGAATPVAFNPALTHPGPRNLPAAAGAATGSGMAFQAVNSFGIGGSGSQTGLNAAMTWIASINVVVPNSATNGQVSDLFLTLGAAITESASANTRHAIGFTATNPSTLGTPSVSGADGNDVSSTGVLTNNTTGFTYNRPANTRTATIDARITVEVIAAGPTITLTPGGVNPAVVPGNGEKYLPALTNAGAFSFAGSNTGATLVAFDLTGSSGVPANLILPSGASVVPGTDLAALFGANLGGSFDFVVNFGNLNSGPFTAAISGLGAGVTLNRTAAIPEPTALGLLAPVALLAARRRRA